METDLIATANDAAEKFKTLFEIDFNREGVEWLDGYIEYRREEINKEEGVEQHNIFKYGCGAFLGRCLIENFGGKWQVDEDGHVGVNINGVDIAYPFSKVHKHFRNGDEDSILVFYDFTNDFRNAKDRSKFLSEAGFVSNENDEKELDNTNPEPMTAQEFFERHGLIPSLLEQLGHKTVLVVPLQKKGGQKYKVIRRR